MTSLPVSVRDNVRDVLLSSPIVSWKTLALLLAIINLKNLPLSWHVSEIPLPFAIIWLTLNQ